MFIMKHSHNAEQGQVILYFQVHQPRRLKRIKFLDIGYGNDFFDDALNREVISRVSSRCYLPTNKKILELINRFPQVKVCFSLSGVAIEQFEMFQPQVLKSFKDLAETGAVEFLGETYYHSLSSLSPNDEFISQVRTHSKLIEHHFDQRPTVFRNTELIYSSGIGSKVAQLGFKGILCDGIERTLDGRSPYQVYKHPVADHFNILLRSNRLSDDIAFRFIEGGRARNADEFCRWIYGATQNRGVVLLGTDYETFGEHFDETTGIVSFLEQLIRKLTTDNIVSLGTPSSAILRTPAGTLDIEDFVSWADEAKDISAWLGNDLQRDAFKTLSALEEQVKRPANTELLHVWRHLQTSDHFYYMCTKAANDGTVHSYFSHYNSPYEAFINFMNTLTELSLRFSGDAVEHNNHLEFERRHNETPVWVNQYAAHVAENLG
jgi:alpha-amylase